MPRNEAFALGGSLNMFYTQNNSNAYEERDCRHLAFLRAAAISGNVVNGVSDNLPPKQHKWLGEFQRRQKNVVRYVLTTHSKLFMRFSSATQITACLTRKASHHNVVCVKNHFICRQMPFESRFQTIEKSVVY